MHTEIPADGQLDLSQRDLDSPYWTIGVFVFSLALFAWVRLVHARKLTQQFKCFVSARFVKQAIREEFVLSHSATLALGVNFIISAGLLLWLIVNEYGLLPPIFISFNEIALFFVCSSIVIGTYAVKTIGIRFTKFLLQADYGIEEYLFNTYLFNNMLGLFLVPVMIAIIFTNEAVADMLLPTAMISAGVFYVLRVFRGIITALGHGASPVYLFLYLCTLEILPLVAIYSVFVRN